jgi:aminoglycoside/choline kinase family phosphotransferase
MSVRQNALNQWLTTALSNSPYTITPIPGDASMRHYFRVSCQGRSYIVMDSPPAQVPLTPFLEIAQRLREHGIHAPQVFASDPHLGFALLEDLGDTLLSHQAYSSNAPLYYTLALDTLVKLQQCETTGLPLFDSAHMQQEMHLFQTWFLEHWLGLEINHAEQQCINRTIDDLCEHLSHQPQQFIHRDYHSRNLLLVAQDTAPSIGVIDFQDAMQGPWTYDLVSLTKDCYHNWSEAQQQQWAHYFYQQLPQHFGYSFAEFQHALDWCGLQRHLKVLGIFCRLHLRDYKSAYLYDLPLTLEHTTRVLARYPEFQALHDFMQERVILPFKEKQPA